MYDVLTTRYTFSCPSRGETSVRLSSFRRLEQLPGASHPVVYRVTFECPCGDEHPGLVAHDDLDWAPLGFDAGRFLNLMTARLEPVETELGDLAARRIQSGDWPWSFYCYPEERPRPVSPSAFLLLAPDGRKLYVANGLTNDLTVIDVPSLKAERSVPVGRLPWGVALKP